MSYLIFFYALFGYIASLATLTFLIFWVYGWEFMKYSVDKPFIVLDGNPFIIDLVLLLLFGFQHSLMARESFKKRFMKRFSPAMVAATYATASSFCLVLIFLFWQPVDGTLWAFHEGVGYWVLTGLYVLGWVFAFIATFIIDHFALFGLRQGYRELRNIPEPKPVFQVKLFYKYVRHPIQAGTLLGLFSASVMSYSHLLFALGMVIYILIGLWFEERSLTALFGESYEAYRRTTPMLIPFLH